MSSPSPCLFQVLANAASKLNTPPKGGKGTVSKLSPTKIGGVVTKKPASRTSPAKLGGVVASSTRARCVQNQDVGLLCMVLDFAGQSQAAVMRYRYDDRPNLAVLGSTTATLTQQQINQLKVPDLIKKVLCVGGKACRFHSQRVRKGDAYNRGIDRNVLLVEGACKFWAGPPGPINATSQAPFQANPDIALRGLQGLQGQGLQSRTATASLLIKGNQFMKEIRKYVVL
eukprot:1149567-Pelagomonas_calceolata.AAC.1